MTAEEALEIVEQILPPGSLTAAQELVFRQSWLGEEYGAIAKAAGYDHSYIRETGAQLWRSLSQVLREPVRKKNFRALLQQRFNLQPLLQKTQPPVASLAISDAPEYPGGPMQLDSPFYIEHQSIQAKACVEITKPGSFLRIKAPPKMGKSSFLLRIMRHADTLGYHTVNVDFRQADDDTFSNLNQFLRWFCVHISYQLGLELQLSQYWHEETSSKVSCTLYMMQYVLKQLNAPLVLSLNEFDVVLTHPKLAWDFLLLLQSWYEEARHIPLLQKLRLVLVHAIDINASAKLSLSSFSATGLPVELPQLNALQVQTLAHRHGLSGLDAGLVQRLMDMVGGHPYLVQLALYHLWAGCVTVDQLLKNAPTQTGIYSDHLQRLLIVLQSDSALVEAVECIINNQSAQVPRKLIAQLEGLGLVQRQSSLIKLSHKLYYLCFKNTFYSSTR